MLNVVIIIWSCIVVEHAIEGIFFSGFEESLNFFDLLLHNQIHFVCFFFLYQGNLILAKSFQSDIIHTFLVFDHVLLL